MQGPEKGNSINLVSYQFIKSVPLVDVQGELFCRVLRHDDIIPIPCFPADGSDGEKVAYVKERDKPFLFMKDERYKLIIRH
jgi:hypothetical protein